MGNLQGQLLLLLPLLSLCTQAQSLWPFSSSSSSSRGGLPLQGAKFTMESVSDPKGLQLVENAKRKLATPDSCWHNAYGSLMSSCPEVVADNEKKSKLAWLLSDCFQTESGKPSFPDCGEGHMMVTCTRKLDESQHKTFLAFYLETNYICRQLQADSFNHETMRLVNDLSMSAHDAESKLGIIRQRSDQLLQGSDKIQKSLDSIHLQHDQLAQTANAVNARIDDVLRNSEAVIEQSKNIADYQVVLKQGQAEMKGAVEAGMARLQKSYEKLGDGMEKLRNETMGIEKEVKSVGKSMASKMKELQTTADDIGNSAGKSLEKQQELLDGQGKALAGLNSLTEFQSKALEESRDSLKKLAELSQKQQEELLYRQELIQRAHDRLIENSKTILDAQEEFKLNQENIFSALDKLHTLYNAVYKESRFTKAVFIYFLMFILLFMVTSTKQTSCIRGRLYLGLFVTLAVEFMIIRNETSDLQYQKWMVSPVDLARGSFVMVASIQLLHSIFTYRDYEILNYQMLQKLVGQKTLSVKDIEYDRMNYQMHQILGAHKSRPLESDSGDSLSSSYESDTSLSQYSWIDDELPEDVDLDEDPNYIPPEEVGENYVSTTLTLRRYDLRPRY